MDKKVNLSFILAVGLMLFSFFFGAGNLIFPPVLGQLAGEHTFLATLGFCISGVGLPLLGIIAMTSNRYKGPDDAGSAVSPMYARIVMVLCALSIGPFFAIPRTAATSFNAGIMLLINPDYEFMGMVVYSVIFFAIAYWMAVHPSKIIDVLGKAMTPVLLIGLVMLLGAAFFGINDLNVASQGAYVTQPLTKGILEGYNTMDLLCAMLFGSATIAVIETQGFVSEKDFLKITLYAGFIAAFFLGIVYAALAYVGLVSVGTVGLIDNGALLLNKICDYYYGSGGAIILAVVFFLACITTAIGLVTSISGYFARIFPRLDYKNWAIVICLFSLVVSNFGLNNIIHYSIPMLVLLYPIIIMLVLLNVFKNVFKRSPYIFRPTMLLTTLCGIHDGMMCAGIGIDAVHKFCQAYLPFYDLGMGWVCPAILGIAIGFVWQSVAKK